MKRLLLVLTAVVLAALIPATALAAEGNESVTIQIGTTQVETGSTVDVPVLIKNCRGIDSVEFDVNYDPAALSVVSITPGDVFPAEYCIYNIDNPGRILIACARALGFNGDGTILTIRFQILSTTGSALTITSHMKPESIGKEVSWIDESDPNYKQSFAYINIEDGGVSIGTGAVPAALVTPWIPETPAPTPTPEPTPTPVPEPAELAQVEQSALPEVSPAPSSGAVDPISYVVVAVLFIILIALIVTSVLKRRKQSSEPQPDRPARKDS